MSNDPQQPGTEILKRIVEKLKVQEFLFALGLVVALAVFGGFILPDYIPLIYLATGVALILYTVTVVTTAYRKVRDAKEGATQARREPSTVIVTVLPPAPSVEPVRPALSEFEQLTMYLDRVRNTNNILRLVGISAEASDPQKSSAEARTPTSLSDVFISLRIDRYRGEPEEQAQGKPDREHQQEMARLLERERKQLTAIEALSDPKVLRCVMLGQPGSGKSSVLRYAAYRLAESFLSPERLKETMPEWQAGEMLSVLAPLALLAESLPARAQGGKLDDHVVAFVQAQVEWCAEMNGFARRVWREARERGVLFLFDGLDEVAPEKRAVVKEAIDEFLSARGKCRAVVTCRTYSYGDDKWRLEGWPAYNIEPLSRGEQESFIQKWYQTLIQNDAPSRPLYEKKAQSLEGAIFSGDARQLHQISGTPLLLTLIAIVHTHQEELPRSRILIYRECVNLLLLRWQKRRQVGDALKSIAERMKDAAPTASGLADKVLEGLAEVAYQARDRDAMKHGDSMLIDLYLLRQVMMRYLPEAALSVFEDYCLNANGLLLAIGSRRLRDRPAHEEPVMCFAFPHLSFEEYLASQYIATLDNPEEALAQRNAASDRWFYAGLFLGEQYALVTPKRARNMLEMFHQLLKDGAAWRNVWLAGVLWPLFCAEFPERRGDPAELEGRVRERLTTLCATGQLLPHERADAGRVLSEMGDPRDLEELVAIPKGPFIMGSKEEGPWLDERPQHEVVIPGDYRIGKYPVTVKLWKRFVDEAKYDPRVPDSLKGYDNHPAHDVSWHDACNFCEWLTDVWRKEGKIGENEEARLPTEAEWERAARDTDGREWPWGNTFEENRANTSESGIRRTTAVGIFPAKEVPTKCLDMIGNVWEWTISLGAEYQDKSYAKRVREFKYPYDPGDEREDMRAADNFSRVVRGGSGGSPGFARCACRGGYLPFYRGGNVGFRVVVSPISLLNP